jgi:signal transduction histidine kinase
MRRRVGENARLRRAADEARREREAAVERMRALTSCLTGISARDLEVSLKTLLDSAVNGSGAASGTLTVLDEGDVVRRIHTGSDEAFHGNSATPSPAEDGTKFPFGAIPLLRQATIPPSHCIFRALKAEEKPIGLLRLVAHPEGAGFAEGDREFVAALVEHASVLVFNHMLYEEAKAGRQALQSAYAELQAQQQRLVRSEKLAAIGQLAAKVSHEINNPLTAISGCTQLLRRRMNEGLDPERFAAYLGRCLETIGAETERCSRITGELLHYSRQKEPRFEETSLHSVLLHVMDLARFKYPGGLEVTADFDPEAPALWADPEQLTQVFLNLLTNAAESMPDGGTVRVTTSLMAADANEARPGRVRVDVIDSGTGIDAESAAQAFEPFYTTKATGTGLGLAISKGIVEQHRGGLTLRPRGGGGTVATVTLPVFGRGDGVFPRHGRTAGEGRVAL